MKNNNTDVRKTIIKQKTGKRATSAGIICQLKTTFRNYKLDFDGNQNQSGCWDGDGNHSTFFFIYTY